MENILTYLIIAIAIFILIKILTLPIKLIFKILINAIAGLVLLFVVNTIGGAFGFSVPVTMLNCLLSGVFGIPGILILILIRIL